MVSEPFGQLSILGCSVSGSRCFTGAPAAPGSHGITSAAAQGPTSSPAPTVTRVVLANCWRAFFRREDRNC